MNGISSWQELPVVWEYWLTTYIPTNLKRLLSLCASQLDELLKKTKTWRVIQVDLVPQRLGRFWAHACDFFGCAIVANDSCYITFNFPANITRWSLHCPAWDREMQRLPDKDTVSAGFLGPAKLRVRPQAQFPGPSCHVSGVVENKQCSGWCKGVSSVGTLVFPCILLIHPQTHWILTLG